MEETRRPRFRLSRRKPPSEGGPRCCPRPPSPGPGVLQDGDRECAQLWAELLRTASADLDVDGELPPLPVFPGQEPELDPERAASPEVFTVGSETFSWTPFPPAPRAGEGPGRSYRVFCAAGGSLGPPARSPQRCSAPEPCRVPNTQEQLTEDGAQALRSCPMCQVDFAPGLAQLDIDSHLAQCLADSTEDMVW